MKKLPPEKVGVVLQWLSGMKNDTTDLSSPQLRHSMEGFYSYLLAGYSLVLVAAIVVNSCLLLAMLRNRLHRDQTFGLLINLVVINLVQSCLVLPPTVTVLLLHTWILGRPLCHLLPLMQDVTIHVSTLTHLLLLQDRYRLVMGHSRLSACVTSLSSWLLVGCALLPYQCYIDFIDLEEYLGHQFTGVGICAATLTGPIRHYTRVLIIVMYLVPVRVMSHIYLRMRREQLRTQCHLYVVYEPRSSSDSTSSISSYRKCRSHCERGVLGPEHHKERQLQTCLGLMSAVSSLCLCPLMALKLVKTTLVETVDNSVYLDLLYSVFVWLAFLPSVTSPLIFMYSQVDKTRTISIRRFLCPTHWRALPNPVAGILPRPVETSARSLLPRLVNMSGLAESRI